MRKLITFLVVLSLCSLFSLPFISTQSGAVLDSEVSYLDEEMGRSGVLEEVDNETHSSFDVSVGEYMYVNVTKVLDDWNNTNTTRFEFDWGDDYITNVEIGDGAEMYELSSLNGSLVYHMYEYSTDYAVVITQYGSESNVIDSVSYQFFVDRIGFNLTGKHIDVNVTNSSMPLDYECVHHDKGIPIKFIRKNYMRESKHWAFSVPSFINESNSEGDLEVTFEPKYFGERLTGMNIGKIIRSSVVISFKRDSDSEVQYAKADNIDGFEVDVDLDDFTVVVEGEFRWFKVMINPSFLDSFSMYYDYIF